MSDPSSLPARLDPSDLGTKEHWDNIYKRDYGTHEQTPDYVGQVWFEESGAETQTIQFLEDAGLDIDPPSCTVLDVGTGNGNMLLSLREEGWEGSLWGIDYSTESVKLARRLIGDQARRKLDDEEVSEEVNATATDFELIRENSLDIHILQHDIFAPWPPSTNDAAPPPESFDLVHDKGTFDAISLSEDAPNACRRYASVMEGLVKPGGYLLVTSCNWTEDELHKWINGDGSSFQSVGAVKYKRFKFGGKEGGVLSGVCWQRLP